jgi:dihydroorotase
VHALRDGVADGTIDIVATDHAPHPVEAKDCEWDAAAFGMVGLESALSVVQAALVDSGVVGWKDVARILSETPARIGRLSGYADGIAVGAAANLALYDPTVSRAFGTGELRGKGVNSPYLATVLPGRVMTVVHDGYPTVLNGELVDTAIVAESARAPRAQGTGAASAGTESPGTDRHASGAHHG